MIVLFEVNFIPLSHGTVRHLNLVNIKEMGILKSIFNRTEMKECRQKSFISDFLVMLFLTSMKILVFIQIEK